MFPRISTLMLFRNEKTSIYISQSSKFSFWSILRWKFSENHSYFIVEFNVYAPALKHYAIDDDRFCLKKCPNIKAKTILCSNTIHMSKWILFTIKRMILQRKCFLYFLKEENKWRTRNPLNLSTKKIQMKYEHDVIMFMFPFYLRISSKSLETNSLLILLHAFEAMKIEIFNLNKLWKYFFI